jgi:hypothetical protein
MSTSASVATLLQQLVTLPGICLVIGSPLAFPPAAASGFPL